MTHDWEKWQKYWAPAVVNEKSIAKRVKHAKSVLGAVEKETDAIVGIHSHADLDRIRDLLSSGEEKHETILVLSLILCDNADVQDFDILIDSNFGDLRNKGRKKSQLIRDSLMKYVRKSG